VRYGIPPEDGEDLLQQALLALLYKQHSIQSPEAWLLGTLRNTCLRYWRSRRLAPVEAVAHDRLEWLSGAAPPSQEIGDLRRDLEAVLGRLPTRCRDVLKLRYALGFRTREVAEVTGYRASNVRKITSRCLQALERELGEAKRQGLASDLHDLHDE
jgi:RNA polymerase sigma-70 factor (ECF subfamily)